MIVPAVYLHQGKAVEWDGRAPGRALSNEPVELVRALSVAGEIALVDVDGLCGSAGSSSHADMVHNLLAEFPCSLETALSGSGEAVKWLDAGATCLVIRADRGVFPEWSRELPRERLMAAVDVDDPEGSTLTELGPVAEFADAVLLNWRTPTGLIHESGGPQLQCPGKMNSGTKSCVRLLSPKPADVAAWDRLGVNVQGGVAPEGLAAAIAALLTSDRADGLWPTVVTDERGKALGLTYSSRESLLQAVKLRRGVYQSRSRGLWVKGETSGAVQELLRVDLDCDRDALRFAVRQMGGFCHTGSRTCWGEDAGLSALARMLAGRSISAPSGSYTRRLLDDPGLLRLKLVEEAAELADAREARDVSQEAADLLYFALVKLASAGVDLAEVERILDRRAVKVSRRPGDAKPATLTPPAT